jgi:hypothetical protein
MIATFSTSFTDDKLFGYKQKFLKKTLLNSHVLKELYTTFPILIVGGIGL